jgi:hypothetical protein
MYSVEHISLLKRSSLRLLCATWTPVRAKEGEIVQRDQTVFEMAQEVLEHQARAMALQTGQTFKAAMQAVADTEAGGQLRELRDGPHRDEKAAEWQVRRSTTTRGLRATWSG